MKAKNMAIVRLLAATIAFASSLVCPGAETNFFFARGSAGQVLRSIGVNTNGPAKEIWYAGEQDGQAALFRLVGTNFSTTNLAELVQGETYVYSISRDAQSVVGISGDEGVLWNVSSPGTALGLGKLPGDTTSDAHGVSVGPTPTVVGASDVGAFVWTAASGIQPFANPPGHGGPRLIAISTDGQTLVGYASSALTSVDPFIYQGGVTTFLDEDGGHISAAITVSPNGNVVGGYIDNQGSIWNAGTPLRLTLNGNSVGRVLGVSDNGFAVGSTAAGGYIYDPRTGITSLFDSWWELQTGNATPVHVTSVNDVYWDGEMLYFALSGSSEGAAAGLAMFPLPNLALALLPSGQIELRWPTNQNGIVESTPGLMPPAWLPLTNPVPTQSNGQFVLTLPATNSATFFRLQFTSP